MAKKTSPLRKIIDESVEDLMGKGFPSDPRMDDAEELGGAERFAKGQKNKDEIVIDTLLSGINGKTGYFLKLKKEVRPNEWMLMKTIESDWRRWADMETAVCDIVKEHTKIAPMKWGTGPYRIEFACKTGIRGQNYDPIDFYVNAEEEFMTPTAQQSGGTPVLDPALQLASTIETVSTFTKALKDLMPPQALPIDPAKTQEQIAGAFQQGLAIKANEGNNSTQMMTTMMTAMMGMMTAIVTGKRDEPRVVNPDPQESFNKMLETLKTFGVLGGSKEKEKTLVDLVTELKIIGVDLFKKDDPLESIGKLKQIAGIASDFMGMGGTAEKPSILEKIVDVLGPAIPKMIQDVKEATQNTVKVQEIAGQNIRQANARMIQGNPTQQTQGTGEPTTYQSMKGGEQVGTAQAPVNEQVRQFFNALYDSVVANNKMYYPIVYTSLLQDAKGQELVQGIIHSKKNAKDLIDMLQEHGDERFKNSEFVMKSLVSYVNGFIIWVRQMSGVSSNPIQETVINETPQESATDYDARCPICGTVYGFENEAEFMLSNKVCEANGTCVGILEPLKV